MGWVIKDSGNNFLLHSCLNQPSTRCEVLLPIPICLHGTVFKHNNKLQFSISINSCSGIIQIVLQSKLLQAKYSNPSQVIIKYTFSTGILSRKRKQCREKNERLSNAQDGTITVIKVFCTDIKQSVKWVLTCGTFVLFSGLYRVGCGV